jgi:hypothetical protein
MSKKALVVGLFTLALTAASVFFFGKSYARDIYTYDCEIAEQRPSQITRFCADGGAGVYEITWETWGYNGASGKGIYSEKLCEPDCAEGESAEVPVDLYLSGIEIIDGRKILRNLSVNTLNGELMANGDSFANWDVAEFAIAMSDN